MRRRLMKKYVKESQETSSIITPMHSLLDALVLEGAKQMIMQALIEETEQARTQLPYKPYRNGYSKERKLTTPVGTMEIRAPRLRASFDSKILAKYQRTSPQFDALMPQLYLHGLSTNDFDSCFRSVLGESAPLSSSSIVRMKQGWEKDYNAWRHQKLESDYLYLWIDGIYPKAGAVDEPLCVLVAMGVNALGEKKILALESGYRESYEAWKSLFSQLKKRGVQWIGLVISDGIQSLHKALHEVFPRTLKQRCWVHKMRNILDKVPPKMHDPVLEELREIYNATSIHEAKHLIGLFVRRYQARYPKAVTSLKEALPHLLTYFQFPKEHWKSIKTTNPIESVFSSVRKRLKATQRIFRRDNAVFLVFQILLVQQSHFRKINKHKSVAMMIDTMKSKSKLKYRAAA